MTAKPKYGDRPIPALIDDKAISDPTKECFAIPVGSEPRFGWKPVSWAQYANAINHMTRFIRESAGPPPTAFPTIAYIGLNDARYLIFVVAAIKAGYKALFISPRNSEEGQLNLFKKTDCNIIYYDSSCSPLAGPWLEKRKMKGIVLSHLDVWLTDEPAPHVPYSRDTEQARWDPFVVLHTSGSTGLPKPVVAPQGMLMINDALHDLPDWQDTFIFFRGYEGCKRALSPMPLFHASGIYGFFGAIYWDFPLALAIGFRPLTEDYVLDLLKYSESEAIFLAPSTLEELSVSDVGTKALSKLKFVGFGGGNLAPEVGKKLVQNGVFLHNCIGSTESTTFPYYWQRNPELWEWFILNPELLGCEWRRASDEEDVFELVIKRKDKQPGLQGTFYAMPDLTEYSTKDLFKKHPTLPNHWKYHGRVDNIIVFSNGEKLNPVALEAAVTGHPKVKGAIVVGSGKFQPALLIEPFTPPADNKEAEAFIEEVWPTIVDANKRTVAHGRISHQLIILTAPDKSFPRLGKDVINRAAAIKLYEREVQELYKQAEEGSINAQFKLDFTSEETLTQSVTELFRQHTYTSIIEADTDILSAGFDSLQILNASRQLRGALTAADVVINPAVITPRAVYVHPSPRRIAAYLYSKPSGESGSGQDESADISRTMDELVKKYTENLPSPTTAKPAPRDTDQTVILTGSTGSLGSHLLSLLCADPTVRKVICLNRAADGRKRQTQAATERGLSTDFAKAEFLHADLSQPDLLLDRDAYARLLAAADRIIHAQHPVNFNLPLAALAPHGAAATRHLVDLAARAARATPVVLISSVLAAVLPPTSGYAASKLVAERILAAASARGAIPTAVVRVGQIAGPEEDGGGGGGVWNRHEWLPAVVASSVRRLGVLPGDLGVMNTVDWLPVGCVARLVLEVAQSVPAAGEQPCFYYGVNPHRTTWGELVGAVRDFYGERITGLVGWKEWVDALERSAAHGDVGGNPALKLLDFYKGTTGTGISARDNAPQFSLEKTLECSEAMREVKAISPELMVAWCRQWGF